MKSSFQAVVLSSPLCRLLHDHQIFCSAHCCRADAFQFSQDSIARWLDFERCDRVEELAEEIQRIALDLQGIDGRVKLDSRGLWSEWSAEEFRAFWRDLQAIYALAAANRRPAGSSSVVADHFSGSTGTHSDPDFGEATGSG